MSSYILYLLFIKSDTFRSSDFWNRTETKCMLKAKIDVFGSLSAVLKTNIGHK